MPLPNPKRKRRYPFKRQLRRKLRKIAFMVIGAAVVSGINYYHKHSEKNTQHNEQLNSK